MFNFKNKDDVLNNPFYKQIINGIIQELNKKFPNLTAEEIETKVNDTSIEIITFVSNTMQEMDTFFDSLNNGRNIG